MQYNGKYFSFIGLALYFSAVNFGAALTALSNSFSSGSGKIPMLAHMAGVFAVALGLSLYLRRRAARAAAGEKLRPARILPALLYAVAALCLVGPVLASSQSGLTWLSLVPPALSMCIFLPVGLYAFFATIPRARQGVQLGLAMAAGELVWLAVLPLLHLVLQGGNNPEPVLYIYKLLGVLMAGIGVCFAVSVMSISALRCSARSPSLPAGETDEPAPFAPSGAETHEQRIHKTMTLSFLFGAGVLFHLFFGVILQGLPRASEHFHIFGIAPLLMTTVGPLAGALLDRALSPREEVLRNRRILRYFPLLLGGAILAVTLWALGTGAEPQERFSIPLLAIRQTLVLSILILSARLAGRSAFLPLLACAAWGLMLFHLPGIQARDFFLAHPGTRLAVMAALAAGSILSLWFAARSLTLYLAHTPPLFPASPAASLPGHAAGNDAATDKLLAFSAAFDLTQREHEILEGFIRNISLDQLSETLGISASTIRFHQTGLLRKTSASTKRRLLQFYAEWEPERLTAPGIPRVTHAAGTAHDAPRG